MVRLIVKPSIVDQPTQEVSADTVFDALRRVFPDHIPRHVRLFQETISESSDITPRMIEDLDYLNEIEGDVYAVGEFHGALAAIALTVGLQFAQYELSKPPDPFRARPTSPTNDLSDRSNRQRLYGRIQHTFGKKQVIPDLITVPYVIYPTGTHTLSEFVWMCVGWDNYKLENWKDGATPAKNIAGLSIQSYDKLTSHNNGVPNAANSVGSAVSEGMYTVYESKSVVGQRLKPPNQGQVTSGFLTFQFPADINVHADGNIDFEAHFAVDDEITITNASFTGNVDPGPGTMNIDLSGTYTVQAVGSSTLTLSNPGLVNPGWDDLDLLIGDGSDIGSCVPTIVENSEKWLGPFTVDDGDFAYLNFSAPSGLWKVPKPEINIWTGQEEETKQEKLDVDFEVEQQPVDVDGNPVGAPTLTQHTMTGSAIVQNARGLTIKVNQGGKTDYRVRRLTNSISQGFQGEGLAEDVQWDKLYGMETITRPHFGKVSLAHIQTSATSGAASVQNRQIKVDATGLIPILNANSNSVPTAESASIRADEIITALCVDTTLGRRQLDELDLENIFSTIADVELYFGTERAIEISITFDDDELSFEDVISRVAAVVHCQAYREGTVIKLRFDKKTDDSEQLFSHRNILPGSQSRKVKFGAENDYDGIELDWIDPSDGEPKTFFVPEDQSASNPKHVEVDGIANLLQARIHAYRQYRRINNLHTVIEFDAIGSADLLGVGSRIRVTDDTSPDTQDGEIAQVVGSTVTLSQPMDMDRVDDDSRIFIQLPDATVQSFRFSVIDARCITLIHVPRIPLTLSDMSPLTYEIVGASDVDTSVFRVTEKEAIDRFTYTIRGVNYDADDYINDKDFLNQVVTEDGVLI